MTTDVNRRLIVIAAGICLLIPAWVGLFASGVPTLYSPLPTLTVLPAFLLLRWHLETIAILVPSFLFLLWSPGLLVKRQPNVPRRTIALLGLLTLLTIVDFGVEWNYGVRYQGASYTTGICILNLMWLALLWWTVSHWRRHPSFSGNLVCHWLLFAWLAWYAFPYLGELP